MIERAWAEEFAREWIAAWNAHDLDRILSHYAEDFEMTSPLIVRRLGLADGRLKGKEAVRSYWGQGLAATSNLQFRLLDVAVGVNAIAIRYESVTLKRIVLERIEFDREARGIRAEALHGAPSGKGE
jgi:hypothetical protein